MTEEYITKAIERFIETVGVEPSSKEEIHIGSSTTLVLTFDSQYKDKILEEYYKFIGNKLFAVKFQE